MNKLELAKAISEKAGLSNKQAVDFINALESVITEQLKNGGEVKMVGFGNFAVQQKAARTGRNPKTGEALQIAATKSVKFSAGKVLKEAVNERNNI